MFQNVSYSVRDVIKTFKSKQVNERKWSMRFINEQIVRKNRV